MKASKALAKATSLTAQVDDLIRPIGQKLAEILEDDAVHICMQPGDGAVVAYNVGFDNACLALTDGIDALLKLNKEDLLKALREAGI